MVAGLETAGVFVRRRSLCLTPGVGKPKRLTQTQTPEVGLRFLDNDRILYSQNGNLFVWNLTNNLITQISKEADQQNSFR